MKLPEVFEVLVITLSDRAFGGDYDDLSGPRVRDRLDEFFSSAGLMCEIWMELIPDDREMLHRIITGGSVKYDLIVTTGGTGIGPRDITVDTVVPLLDKEIPGIMEFIRVKYGADKPSALLSRGVAGIIGRSLVYTLPGSVRAVDEYLDVILKTLLHTFYMQHGIDTHPKH